MERGRHHQPRRRRRTLLPVLFLLLGGLSSAHALVSFDFETPYLVHPGLQVWDFCLVQDQGIYHAFYHTLPPDDLFPANADTIWHAVSTDLRRWDILGPALTTGSDPWDGAAMWAPDVVFDDQTGRWAMLYTGVASNMVQRPCLAWSDDLDTWEKSAANPVFEPDSVTYYWAPTQAWSSFRDPFLYHDGQQWNMLSTARLRLGGVPGYPRGIVHRATSTDLENWQDAGVFYEHDGTSGRSFDLESVQYIVRDGWHHLFFTEQDPAIEIHPTTHLVAADPSGWTMAGRTIIDPGWATEIEPALHPGGPDLFARLSKSQDPRDGTWFVAAKFDSVLFEPTGMAPAIISADPLGADWPTRLGAAGLAAPTFGDNPVLRSEPAIFPAGHGWFGSGENFGGPLSVNDQPGAALGDSATGSLESRPFTVTGDYFRLLMAGGNHPTTCYAALVDGETSVLLTTLAPVSDTILAEQFWDVREFFGRTVRLAIVDEESGPGGWLAVDSIEEFSGASPVADLNTSGVLVTGLGARPNPFNGGTVIRFDMAQAGRVHLEVFDLRGRRVWRSAERVVSEGEVAVPWNSTDNGGRSLPSGAYFCRVVHEGATVARAHFTLVK